MRSMAAIRQNFSLEKRPFSLFAYLFDFALIMIDSIKALLLFSHWIKRRRLRRNNGIHI